jgi:nucleotide-binding universal stress UspA family protein
MPAELVEERTQEMSTFPTKILLATDGSQNATKAAQMASYIANTSDSELHVLHIGNMKDFHIAPGAEQSFSARSGTLGEIREKAEKTLDKAVKQVEQVGGTVAESHLRMGDPDEEIRSVSESVVRHAQCPVLVARS